MLIELLKMSTSDNNGKTIDSSAELSDTEDKNMIDAILEINNLYAIRQQKVMRKEYEQAIETAHDIIDLAEKNKLQAHINTQKSFIMHIERNFIK